jgi:hypothetical protein
MVRLALKGLLKVTIVDGNVLFCKIFLKSEFIFVFARPVLLREFSFLEIRSREFEFFVILLLS